MIEGKKVSHCRYCGAEIEWSDGNNPWDDGLHDIKDKYSDGGSVCCSKCNAITYINRQFKRMIEHPEETNLCLFEIKDAVSGLDENELAEYYMRQKEARVNCRSIPE